MDVKTYGIAATPRNGKAVEINSLWYNSLMIMIDLTEKLKINQNEKNITIETNKYKTKIKKYKDIAKKCRKSFNEKFYNSKRKCLYDVLGDSRITCGSGLIPNTQINRSSI